MRLDGVWLRYRRGEPWVLRGVEASVAAGEAVAVVGRNGVGKSTLLKLAAGLLRPQRGAVRERPARVGYVPERFPADQPFTARRYLLGMAAIHGLAPADGRRAVGEWAERLHLDPLLDSPLAELSKGSAQKVGLVQGLVHRPDLLILDEPWEGLDAATRAKVPAIVAQTLDRGGRVLISDHLGEVGSLPDVRTWELVDGQLSTPELAPVECVIEVAVTGAEVDAAVASLRAAGHRVLGVRIPS
ncbi:ATP-binding cassette domain-containing protein [Phytohabitans flavus]|uniref:ABC transporter ATP-binding protein n=1 Tax=Phytohabitans flavus TaxID=1076124 RepID=A0A6F8XTG8_9ACTN|nr:ATP-binding cassette domain-containing protein [Phytohabitans flavus]BCB77041.1 ABC transporter ATP-binding protein [Phytohabitans flavus]